MSPLEASGKPLFFLTDEAAGPPPDLPASWGGTALRTLARSLEGMQKEALVRSSATGATWRLATDEGGYLNGADVAPCPLSFLTTGMVCSFMEGLGCLARERGVELPELRLIQDNYYTMKGSALRGTMVGGALPVDLQIQTRSGIAPETLIELGREAVRRSPIHGLLRAPLASLFSLTHNGHAIPLGAARPVPAAPPPAPAAWIDAAVPAPGGWSGLIVRNGMSPKTGEVTSSQGSSYAAEQDRRLHVRAICTLRGDGIKAIEQQLFNPHGSIFHYLSEEPTADGHPGRAPDALTYASAGIAFCFMTQLGRYARIARKPLEAYDVIQDTHFRTSEDGGGEADPVETHVYIKSAPDDEFARKALDMSEQTCFLHALCRTELSVEVRDGRQSRSAEAR